MTTTVTFHHPAGHAHLHAVLSLKKIIILPESGVFEVTYGVWENESALRCNTEPLHAGFVTYPISDFPTMLSALYRVSDLIIDSLDTVTIPKEENQ